MTIAVRRVAWCHPDPICRSTTPASVAALGAAFRRLYSTSCSSQSIAYSVTCVDNDDSVPSAQGTLLRGEG
jgi:hypothetical protein